MEILGAYGSLTLDGKTITHNGKMYVHGDITQAGESGVLPTTDGLDNVSKEVDLTAGPHKLALTISPDTSQQPVQIRLSWLTPEQQNANYQAAIDAAHTNAAVGKLWVRYAEACEIVPLKDLKEASDMFASFEPVEL